MSSLPSSPGVCDKEAREREGGRGRERERERVGGRERVREAGEKGQMKLSQVLNSPYRPTLSLRDVRYSRSTVPRIVLRALYALSGNLIVQFSVSCFALSSTLGVLCPTRSDGTEEGIR
eukprot:2584697-Rhodomonas_salina.1